MSIGTLSNAREVSTPTAPEAEWLVVGWDNETGRAWVAKSGLSERAAAEEAERLVRSVIGTASSEDYMALARSEYDRSQQSTGQA